MIDGWWTTKSIAKPHAITCSGKKERRLPTLTGLERGGTQKYVLSVHAYEGTNDRGCAAESIEGEYLVGCTTTIQIIDAIEIMD